MKFATLIATLAALLTGQMASAQVTHLTEKQWVKSVDGNLVGRVILPTAGGSASAVKDAVVAVVGKDGKVITSNAKTDESGKFTIEGVSPGVYALTARADYVFACCAMHVLGSDATAEYPASVEVAAANIDFTTVKTAMIRYMPPKVRAFDATIDEANLSGLSPRVNGKDFFRVIQTNDGMNGRLHTAGARGADLEEAKLTNVFIMKDGLEAARAVTNEAGEFSIEKLDPGQYSLMAIGPDGMGMVGFELVDPKTLEATASTTADGKTLTGLSAGCCCQEFAMQVAPPCEQIFTEVVIEEPCCEEVVLEPAVPVEGEICCEPLGTPLGGGYAGYGGGAYYGGGGGGGGFVGGGGGLGTIAGLAGLGGVIAAVADDDDGEIEVPPAASPAVPN